MIHKATEPVRNVVVMPVDAVIERPAQSTGNILMGSTMDKIKGLANEAAGNVKQAAGKALDKPGLQAEGIAQERKGEAQQALGKGKEAVKKVVDKA